MKMNIKNIIKTIFVIACVIILFFIFCFLPDILLKIRLCLVKCPIFESLIQPDVTNTIYIEIISGLFLNSIAILISVFAYKTANEARKIQEKQNNIQIIQAASKLVDLIRNDLTVMYDLHKQMGTENDLDILNANDYICCLYSNKKINNKDYNYLLVLFKKIEIIKNYYNSPNITEKERNINEFMSTYFINNGIDKNQDLEKILDKIAKIIE